MEQKTTQVNETEQNVLQEEPTAKAITMVL